MKKAGIRIDTFVGAGRFQHTVYYSGKLEDVSNEVVEMLKKVNERLYEEMPQGSKGLVSRIEYRHP